MTGVSPTRPSEPRTAVVTAFVRYRGRILLLRRSERVGSYRGCWAGVSGFVEEVSAEAQVWRELDEETGLGPAQLRLVVAAPPLPVDDDALGRHWLVYPFLFELMRQTRLRTDWEHDSWRWVRPEALAALPTVPRLAQALRACLELERQAMTAAES